jgi:hypothetical protein
MPDLSSWWFLRIFANCQDDEAISQNLTIESAHVHYEPKLTLIDALDLAALLEVEAFNWYTRFAERLGSRYADDAASVFESMANNENKHGEQLAQRRLALFGDERPKVIANAGRVMTHPHLLREVWGPTHSESTQYLRVYMGNLQQKLEDDSAQPKHIVTETGVGYRLLAD